MPSDTNIIQISYSKDLQPLIEDLVSDLRDSIKTKDKLKAEAQQAKVNANKHKWDSALKTINQNGALDKILLQTANAFLGEDEPVIPSPPKKAKASKA